MDELTKSELARIRDEDQRQNRRIELLEDMSKVKRHGADAPRAEGTGETPG